ncbi:hypothetical protein [Tamlana crocina]|uniref:Uncharacterized protein n=1 Tax=Tamlana crocina TaxID=393006 RepID=A0ABX1DB96_9FLAO|nr:hypothetical protein [Tamlana crocina]NJX15342.1 hypothetical protein [Tamlana crocina]
MPEKFIEFKALVLKNNCPQCYSTDGLRLTFKQKIVETALYKSITSEIQDKLACETCNSIIYPVQWTDDIERVVEYQKKAFTPKKPSTYLKKATWLIIVAVILAVIAILFFVFYSEL